MGFLEPQIITPYQIEYLNVDSELFRFIGYGLMYRWNDGDMIFNYYVHLDLSTQQFMDIYASLGLTEDSTWIELLVEVLPC